jgi:hypothetical protein
MKRYRTFAGNAVWLAPEHIVSVAGNSAATGTIIRMVNQDQWAVTDEPEDVVSELEWGK